MTGRSLSDLLLCIYTRAHKQSDTHLVAEARRMIQLLRAAAYGIPTESPLETQDLYSAAVKL